MSQIKVEIEPHFDGDYELKYDGKYLSLYGKDNRLVPVVIEQRGIAPEIIEVDNEFIYIELNEIK